MKIYTAFLRGINVSGQKSIKMADLRIYMQELGLINVETYIQSGNIVFESEILNQAELEEKIIEKIKEKYSFEVKTFVLEQSELKKLLAEDTFINSPGVDSKFLYISLLSSIPEQKNLSRLNSVDLNPEIYKIEKKCMYFYVPNGYSKAKLNNNYIENKLKLSATTRNWRTMNTLMQMCNKRV